MAVIRSCQSCLSFRSMACFGYRRRCYNDICIFFWGRKFQAADGNGAALGALGRPYIVYNSGYGLSLHRRRIGVFRSIQAGAIMHGLIFFVLLYLANPAIAIAGENGGAMKLTSPEFENNFNMPARFTCEGQDVNPELNIQNIPSDTKSLALIVDDPDAPVKTWVHWVVFDIAPTNKIFEDSIPGKQGINDFGKLDWGGPCPPSGTHRYFFKIYALDKILGLKEGIDKAALEKSMEGHILGEAELVGLYKRGSKNGG